MKVLVVGNGGREHAIAWKLVQSAQVNLCLCVPGNGGTANLAKCENIPLSVEDFAGISELCKDNQVDLVIVGQKSPFL